MNLPAFILPEYFSRAHKAVDITAGFIGPGDRQLTSHT